jgi:hypothetical protein
MVSFWLNLIVVLLAHQRIGDYTDGEVSGQIGNALWIALGSPVGYIVILHPFCHLGTYRTPPNSHTACDII